MSRKDYSILAAAFATTQPEPRKRAAHAQWKTDVMRVSTALAADNYRFDIDRFLAACGIE